ncbi:MAG: hypothetical protein FJ025_00500 [Chloroflexi bacterium]|nr:hypothetical protein [Chloroflexota bacterium]
MECYNNAVQLGSPVAKGNKERLIERGIPDEGGTLSDGQQNRESFESLKVEASTIYVLQKLEGEAFDVTMYVHYGLPPYRWRLLYTSGVADNVSLNLADEAGEILNVSGTAAYINDPTTESRLGWVMFEVTDSSQPTKWGKGGFAIRVNQEDEEEVARQVARAWAQSNLGAMQSALQQALAGSEAYGNASVSYSEPTYLGPHRYQAKVTLTMSVGLEGIGVKASLDSILTIDTNEKSVINVEYGEVRTSW